MRAARRGRVCADADPAHRFVLWSLMSGTLGLDVGGAIHNELSPATVPDGLGAITSADSCHEVAVVTSADTAAVALEVDGTPVVWQRPVARIAMLSVLDTRPSDEFAAAITVRELAADGRELAVHTGDAR